jgi:hypothetical protein
MTVWYARCTLHTRQSFTHSDKYQVSHRYSYCSWWWAHIRPKRVEKRNKHTKKNFAPSWLYLRDYTGRDLNPVPLTDEAGVLTSKPQHSVSSNTFCIFFKFDFVSICINFCIRHPFQQKKLRECIVRLSLSVSFLAILLWVRICHTCCLFYSVGWLVSVAYPGILFGGGVQQIQLRTERTGIWGQLPDDGHRPKHVEAF